MRTIAIPALPDAVERAYIVLPGIGSSLELVFRFCVCNDEVRNGCLELFDLQQLALRDTRHGRRLRRVGQPPCCFKRDFMPFLALKTAFCLIDLDNAYISLLLSFGKRVQRSPKFRMLMPRILGLNNTATESFDIVKINCPSYNDESR